jgi:hypothetical protein
MTDVKDKIKGLTVKSGAIVNTKDIHATSKMQTFRPPVTLEEVFDPPL